MLYVSTGCGVYSGLLVSTLHGHVGTTSPYGAVLLVTLLMGEGALLAEQKISIITLRISGSFKVPKSLPNLFKLSKEYLKGN